MICAEAGLSLDTALNRVADEMAVSAPELADELALTSVELNFLPERRMALGNLAKRVDLPAIRGVVNTLIQTEKYGTPLAQSLRVLSAEFREQRMLQGRGEGGAPAGDADRADDHVHPADPVHRPGRPGHARRLRPDEQVRRSARIDIDAPPRCWGIVRRRTAAQPRRRGAIVD